MISTESACPVCRAEGNHQPCQACGSRYQAIPLSVRPSRLVDVVSQLNKDWRGTADILRVCPGHLSAVTGVESLCGIRIVPSNGNVTIMLAKPPQNGCFVHVLTGKLLVHRHGYFTFATGETHEAEGVLPWKAVMPTLLSEWRDIRVSGRSILITAYDLDREGCLYFLGAKRERISFNEWRDGFVRFDRDDPPRVGSLWRLRGSDSESLVAGRIVHVGLFYVELRQVHGSFDLVQNTGRYLPVSDLWRNYEQVLAEPCDMPTNVGDEWENQEGRSVFVESVNPGLGVVGIIAGGVSCSVLARVFRKWTKIERVTAFERLMRD